MPDLSRAGLVDHSQWIAWFDEVRLEAVVPEPVRRLFKLACGSMIYGWLYYPLLSVGFEECGRCLEAGVRDAAVPLATPAIGNPGEARAGLRITAEQLNKLFCTRGGPRQQPDIVRSIRGDATATQVIDLDPLRDRPQVPRTCSNSSSVVKYYRRDCREGAQVRPARPAVLEETFRFLRKHHRHNKKLQDAYIWQMIGSSRTAQQKAIMLLERTVHTQSQPRLASIAAFFRSLAGAPETSGPRVLKTRLQRNALGSLGGFARFVTAAHQIDERVKPDERLLFGLRRQPGWGPKTAALLVRNLALISRSAKLRQGFWPDIGEMRKSAIFLPVDAVILEVFAALKCHPDMAGAGPLDSFDRINKYLRHELRYSDRDMLCWDDLWFWGFINQRSSVGSKRRRWEWNPDKYWSIPHTPKSPPTLAAIERASREFRQCLGVERTGAAKHLRRESPAARRAVA